MSADEFEIIARCFAPLASISGARGLLDDAALLVDEPRLVITADTIVDGVHFLSGDPLDTVAQKALRVNISDLVAKGARPAFYMLTLLWPDSRPADGIETLARGLAADQSAYGLSLLGGDTTRTPGPLSLAVTMLGRPCGARCPSRAEAKVGEDVWVTGPIGDGALGLRAARDELSLPGDALAHLIEKYRRPAPLLATADLISACAGAAMDVSDGLLGDAEKLASASSVRIVIEPERVPLSRACRLWLEGQADAREALAALLNGGDDYEVLFTSAPGVRDLVRLAAPAAARIGAVAEGAGVEAGGLPIGGHRHRLGRKG